MFGFLLRVLLIGLVIYVVVALFCGGRDTIYQHYWWMRPYDLSAKNVP